MQFIFNKRNKMFLNTWYDWFYSYLFYMFSKSVSIKHKRQYLGEYKTIAD